MYGSIIVVLIVAALTAAVVIWFLYRVVGMMEDVRYLANQAKTNEEESRRRTTPLQVAIIVAGVIATPVAISLLLNINLFGWLFV